MIRKIITGYVVQRFDEDAGEFVSQEFVAGDGVEFEDDDGIATADEPEEMEGFYLPMKMVQPDPIKDEWTKIHGAAVYGPNAVECVNCGSTLFGDKPTIVIECLDCFRKNYITLEEGPNGKEG